MANRPLNSFPYCHSILLGLFIAVSGTAFAATEVGTPADKNACVNIVTKGARAGADSNAAINDALNAAKSSAVKCIYVPAGTYNITKITIDGGVKIIGDGDSSVLFSPDAAKHNVILGGDGSGIYSLQIKTHGTARTGSNDGIWIDGNAKNFIINNVLVDGSNAAGIITYGGSYGRITHNRVQNTKSDSIHMSGGANHIYVAGNTVRNSGDDCIAIVTYQSQPVIAHDILIENNDIADQPWGRGITVAGGENVTVRNNKIANTCAAGILIASESSWNTYGDNNVIVDGNILDQTPHNCLQTGHPSVLLYSDTGKPIQNIKFTNNTITNSPNGPVRIDGGARNVFCQRNTYNGSPVSPKNCDGNGAEVTGADITSSILSRSTVTVEDCQSASKY